MYSRLLLITLLSSIIFLGCQQDTDEAVTEEGSETVIKSLPFNTIDLSDLSAFQSTGANWSVAGQVVSNFEKEKDLQTSEGTGILVNQPTEADRENLLTSWEHQDLELKLSFLMPKGSNSGIYLQGRYEVQLFDSWMKEEPNFSDLGGIYQRWDEAAEKGYEGHPPRLNAAKAPGLWQDLYISFIAPRFDQNGNKVSNARFELVELNGVVIHENVELTGPTRAAMAEDEVATAPLMIQGDHGPVAVKNIEYKNYTDERLLLNDLQYEYYAINQPINQLPDFDTLTVTDSGSTDSLNTLALAQQEDEYAIRFSGKLEVEKSGQYLFFLYSDDGSKLYLDDELLISNDFNHGMDEEARGLVELSAGTHDLTLNYYNNTWGKGLALMYEGPEMKYQPLYTRAVPGNRFQDITPLIVPIAERPELLRGFLNYQDEKRTHIISVGQPTGVHYAIDLDKGALVKVWRGPFADVAEMWRGRGHQQLIKPLSMAIEGLDAPIAAKLPTAEAPYPSQTPDDLKLDRYELDAEGYPEFFFKLSGTSVSEKVTTADEQQAITRTIKAGEGDNLYSLIAKGDYIEQLENDYYSVGGQYFIKIEDGQDGITIREMGSQQEMLFNLGQGEVKYVILW